MIRKVSRRGVGREGRGFGRKRLPERSVRRDHLDAGKALAQQFGSMDAIMN